MAYQKEAQIGGILSYFTRHRTVANLLLLLMLAAGLIAFPNMRAQFFPDVVVDDIDITVQWAGAGAEAVDEGIVQILEPALLAVEGVTASSARATEGRASLTLEFEPGTDIERANEDVQFVLDSTGNLPADAEDPAAGCTVAAVPVAAVVLSRVPAQRLQGSLELRCLRRHQLLDLAR